MISQQRLKEGKQQAIHVYLIAGVLFLLSSNYDYFQFNMELFSILQLDTYLVSCNCVPTFKSTFNYVC